MHQKVDLAASPPFKYARICRTGQMDGLLLRYSAYALYGIGLFWSER